MTDYRWRHSHVASPTLANPISVLAVRDVPYQRDANRLQNLTIYLPDIPGHAHLIDTPLVSLPEGADGGPHLQVHVHGGAWRDPMLDARSIEAAVACAFAEPESGLTAIISINHTLTQFPRHPSFPYDAEADRHADPAREAVHPHHLRDVLAGLVFLKNLGLSDNSYILTGHSAGACIVFQAALGGAELFGLNIALEPPVPTAIAGLNGLYDLPGLVLGLGPSHEANGHDYRTMLTNAFGPDDRDWNAASPAWFDIAWMTERLRAGRAPKVVLLDQSERDQLVPMNQRDRLAEHLARVPGLEIVIGHHCTGRHAEPWQKGEAIWNAVRDLLRRTRQARVGSRLITSS